MTVRRSPERPILVDGEFSDQDLWSLVLFIRSKPTPKGAGAFAMGVSGAYPIMPIGRQNDGSVWVRMSEDGGTGEIAIVRRTKSGWQVMEVGWWVA